MSQYVITLQKTHRQGSNRAILTIYSSTELHWQHVAKARVTGPEADIHSLARRLHESGRCGAVLDCPSASRPTLPEIHPVDLSGYDHLIYPHNVIANAQLKGES